MIFIDIGAYNGDTLSKGISRYPRCTKYIGFEPDSANYKLLKERFKDNDKVELYPLAVEGGNKLYKGATPQSHSMFSTKNNVSEEFITVGSCSILSVMEGYKNEDFILKINAEGVEYEILEKLIKSGHLKLCKHLIVQWHVEKIGEITQERHDALLIKLERWGIKIHSVRSFKSG